MLRLAEKEELPRIGEIAEPIWREHYTPIIGNEQVEYMLQNIYSNDALIKQKLEGQDFYFIEKNKEEIGFIAVSKKIAGQWFLHKFYLAPEHQNKHLGEEVLKELSAFIVESDDSDTIEIRLTVNRINYKSINFYFKHGFKIESVADFDIGSGYFMNDFVLIKSIKKQ